MRIEKQTSPEGIEPKTFRLPFRRSTIELTQTSKLRERISGDPQTTDQLQ